MNRQPLILAGSFLGVGMGAFVDGIVLHQLLQAHSMLSARYPLTSVTNLEINMFWDGLFHAFAWLTTAMGIALLWRALSPPEAPRCPGTMVGALLLGWGLFNLVEGLVNHHLLHLHHVRETSDHLAYDLAFLASGVALVGVGLWLIRRMKGKQA